MDPDFYHQVKDPVVFRILALYGHPDSPTFWELHCAEKADSKGFEAVGPEWPSAVCHAELKLLLSIYLDDFKMSGPKENLAKG